MIWLDGLTRWFDQMTSLSFLSQYCCASHHLHTSQKGPCQKFTMYYFSYAQIIYNIPVSVSVGIVDQFILLLVSADGYDEMNVIGTRYIYL